MRNAGKEKPRLCGAFCEADERARTVDLLHGKQTLYQLSYIREASSVAESSPSPTRPYGQVRSRSRFGPPVAAPSRLLLVRCGPRGGDSFESGIDTEGLKETADVVPYRLWAQVELGGDLLRRATLLEQTEYLDLAGSEMWRWGCGAVVGLFLDQPEDADDPLTVHERHRAELYGNPPPAVETKTPLASVAGEVPSTFWEKSSRARRLSSGATTEVKWRPRTSPTSRSAARIEPADNSRIVEHVARDADTVQSLLDVAANSQAEAITEKCR